MRKTITSDELDAIVLTVAKHPSGIRIAALAEALASDASARTLQRRVASLVRDKRLEALGTGRSTKYRLPTLVVNLEAAGVSSATSLSRPSIEVYVPVSPEGESIREYVRRPIQQRHPVSYDIAFLEAYEPNHTHYLPDVAAAPASRAGPRGRRPGRSGRHLRARHPSTPAD